MAESSAGRCACALVRPAHIFHLCVCVRVRGVVVLYACALARVCMRELGARDDTLYIRACPTPTLVLSVCGDCVRQGMHCH